MLNQLLRKKTFTTTSSGLKRCLTVSDLTLMGIGAVIGAGVFVLTGIVAATHSGPAIMISYILAGLTCCIAALAYAELASAYGGSGGAYGYAYAAFGELAAWCIGWALMLEYGITVASVAIGWSSYFSNSLQAIGWGLPSWLITGPFEGGMINLPAMGIIGIITYLLTQGTHHTAKLNRAIVVIKIAVLGLFVVVAWSDFNLDNWKPFAPFGWDGIAKGASMIFFAYVGFDAIATAADETINPQRTIPISIMASLAICTLVYVVVSGVLTGVMPYYELNTSSPVTTALLKLGYNWAAVVVSIGAIAGLTTVILVMFFGLTRIVFAMCRDGLLPQKVSALHPKTQTPQHLILALGCIFALLAGIAPIAQLTQLVNIGTLYAFTFVSAGVGVLRYTQPGLVRPFKMPLAPWLPMLGVGTSVFLIANLSHTTITASFIWMAVGIMIYWMYGRRHSLLAMA